ncbi:hypothetical protein J7L67_01880 [bacterium]|nr:hypothetical protein [bacterium]
MRSLNVDYIIEKNKRENQPIFLYTVFDYDNNGTNLCLTDNDENVYFDGVEYLRFPITHQPISENSQGQIDQVRITVSNVSREIEFYINEYDGLRDKKVSIKQIFRDTISNPDAVIEDLFYIDYPTSNENSVVFLASSKFDINDVTIPRKIYSRDDFPGIPTKRVYIA